MTQVSVIDELRGARWFGGKSRGLRSASVVDRAAWADLTLRLVQVSYDDGGSETYVLLERLEDPAVPRSLLRQFDGTTVRTERGGNLVFEPTHLLRELDRGRTEPISVLRGEQSNTSIRFGDSVILKLFRRVQFGPNPEVEIGWFLTEHTDFHGTSAVVGSLEYHSPDGARASVALLQQFVPNIGDAWQTTLQRLSRGDFSTSPIARLGDTTGALHVALAQSGGGPEFDPEPIADADVNAWHAAISSELCQAARALRQHGATVDEKQLLARADGIRALAGACKIRHHGDYHLGQVLESPDGAFVIIDFEGEPAKSLSLRREKRSPLRDVAGMLRSLDYARHAAARAGNAEPHALNDWYLAARAAFLDAYFARVRPGAPQLLPKDIEPALGAFELEKAAYEVLYELNNRPDWVAIPLAALQ